MSDIEELLPIVIQSFEFEDEKLSDLEPYEFQLSEELSHPYRLNLSLVAKDPSVDESKLVGHACTLTLTRGGLVRYINGLVIDAVFSGIALDVMTPQGNLPAGLIHLTIVPALELLRQRRNSRIFQNLKVTDILKKVLEEALGDYGRKVKMKTSKDYQELEYCTQYDETDFDFVRRLMATEGIMSYFVQGEKAEELVLFDDADSYVELVTMNHGKVPFQTSIVESHTLETVRRFQVDTRLVPTTASVRAFNWSGGGAPDDSAAQGKDGLKREREWYLGEAPVALGALGGDGVYAKTSARGQVKLIQEVARSRIHRANGSGDVTGLSPGVSFDFENALREELNRKYLVIRATHMGVRPGDAKKGTFAGDVGEVVYSNEFECVASDVLYRLETPPRRFIQTMQTAIVVGDEDITTDVHGRIKVQFHWDRQGKNDIKSSCWVRVAQASAGVGFGCVFIPRKGQEVVVTFLEGNPDRPLVIGSVYNGVNTPPYALPDEKTRSVIRTRSTPDSDGYNEISFEDAKDSEELYVQAQKDMDKLVKHDLTVTIGNNETLRVGDDSKGGKTKDGNRSRWVKNNESIEVGGNQTITVHKSKNETIDVDASEAVTGKKEINVTKTFKTTVGEDAVDTISGAYSQNVTKLVKETFSDTQKTSITKDRILEVTENCTIKIGKKKTEGTESLEVTVDKAHGEKAESRKTQVTKSYEIKAKTLTIDVESEVTIKVGSSQIVVNSSGVVVKGSKATVQSSGNVSVKGSKVSLNG